MTIKKEAILERLNPADSFTLAMDEEIRRDGLAGSYGCFALELSNIPDIAELERRITEFSQRFPVVSGQSATDRPTLLLVQAHRSAPAVFPASLPGRPQ